MVPAVAHEITLPRARAEPDVFEATAARRGDDGLRRPVVPHEVDEVGILARPVRVVARGARRLRSDHVNVMGERIRLVVDQKAPIMTFVTEVVRLQRLRAGIVYLVLSLEDR